MDSHCTPEEKKMIQLNESTIKDHLGEMVRGTVEETLNQLLDAEADHLCNAEKYQCSEDRKNMRQGIISANCIPRPMIMNG